MRRGGAPSENPPDAVAGAAPPASGNGAGTTAPKGATGTALGIAGAPPPNANGAGVPNEVLKGAGAPKAGRGAGVVLSAPNTVDALGAAAAGAPNGDAACAPKTDSAAIVPDAEILRALVSVAKLSTLSAIGENGTYPVTVL